MIYFLLLIALLIVFFGINQFIKIPSVPESVFHFFIQQITVLTFFISVFAVLITGGKTIFVLFLPLFIYFIAKRHIVFKKLTKVDLIKNTPFLLLIIPIVFIQFILHFDILSFTPYLPSDDVLLYAGYSNGLLEYGQENKFEALNSLYPQLFSGMAPYHYYEIWFTALIGFITDKSYVFILLLVVYPYLVWIFVLGILSIFEFFAKKIHTKHYVFAFLLLFIGPLYIPIYEHIFHDGEFFSSTVFTVSGFVKQTLPFSYYGQKHLPVYLFGIFSFLFLLKQNYKLSILIGLLTTICSIGTLPGVFGAFGLLFLLKKKIRTKEIFFILFIAGISIVVIISLFKMGINNEVSEKTFYLKDFLKYLNIKGEILRFASKFIGPLIWFSILYFPFILLLGIFRRTISLNSEIKILLQFIVFSFLFGAFSISLVQGLNSDQFLTNLLPLFNVVMIITLIYLIEHMSRNKKIIYFIISGAVVINSAFIFYFHRLHSIKIEKRYSITTIYKVKELLKKQKTKPVIAYLLADNFLQAYAPVTWYPHKPGQIFCIDNYYNLININYPYTKYDRNSCSIAFGPDNQMRFFLKDKFVETDDFGKYQEQFLKQNKIEWLFCKKDATLYPSVEKLIEKTFFNKVSGETYYKLRY